MRFVESTLYPFIGGDTVRREEPMAGGLQPAVNRIFLTIFTLAFSRLSISMSLSK